LESILITGSTGSFGRAFVKRLLDDNLANRICIYSRDEVKQAMMRYDFNDDPRLRFFIGDIRDKERLIEAMNGVDVVCHSAALKRVETCEYSPIEVTKTNILGSVNVIEAAFLAKVDKVVALSTDKAAQVSGVYGASKLMAEKLFIAANNMHGDHGPKFSCVRYGNIWRSRGSVVPTWERILRESDTVPVTDPDATRYFMRQEEAVQLVLDTINTMTGGETNIPDLPAYRVGDLAEAMGAKMEIKGLPDIENKHETMDGIITSETARRMTVDELREVLKDV